MFSLFGSVLFQKDNCFEVMRLGEHIHRLNCPDNESVTDKFLQISAQGGRIAADVDDPMAGQTSGQVGQAGQAPARRVTDNGSKSFAPGNEITAC